MALGSNARALFAGRSSLVAQALLTTQLRLAPSLLAAPPPFGSRCLQSQNLTTSLPSSPKIDGQPIRVASWPDPYASVRSHIPAIHHLQLPTPTSSTCYSTVYDIGCSQSNYSPDIFELFMRVNQQSFRIG
ncbi:hypothetical protein IWX49DRAFT_551377 [Phyllosticta citricarpa]|uniref:Uncharacterized protein n=2 Tax=Phyllosticta TaxID=121621 RepID=A0ABR1LWI1_9PEZI